MSLFIAVLLAILFFTWNIKEIKQILAINIFTLVSLSLLVLSTQLINGLRLKILTSSLGLQLRPKDWIGVAIVQSLLNYLPFKGGMVANALYLKKWHNFSFSNFISMISASGIITILSAGLIGFTVSGVCILNKNINIAIPGLFFSITLIAMLFIIFSRRFKFSNGIIGRRLNELIRGWNIMREKGSTLFSLVILDIISVLIFSLRYYIAFRAFSFSIPFWCCIILAPLSILSTRLSFTPAGMGIKEAAVGFASKILGTGLNLGIYAASLDRAVVMFWVFLLGPIFGFMLLHAEKTSSS